MEAAKYHPDIMGLPREIRISEIENRLATKFANILASGSDRQKKVLLASLAGFPLRRADIYDLDADMGKAAPPVYNRIGNDIEQIAFFGESGARIARALAPLLDEPDAEMRGLAAEAALLVRDVRFGDVNRIAGPSSPEANGLFAKMEGIPEAVRHRETGLLVDGVQASTDTVYGYPRWKRLLYRAIASCRNGVSFHVRLGAPERK
jgi:hypothetical protein